MSNGRARRGSIFSGAVLILVGALLLVVFPLVAAAADFLGRSEALRANGGAAH